MGVDSGRRDYTGWSPYGSNLNTNPGFNVDLRPSYYGYLPREASSRLASRGITPTPAKPAAKKPKKGDTRVNAAGKKYRWNGKKWVSWGNPWQVNAAGGQPTGGGSGGGGGGGGSVGGGGTATGGTSGVPNLMKWGNKYQQALDLYSKASPEVFNQAAAKFLPSWDRNQYLSAAQAMAAAEAAGLKQVYTDAAARLASQREGAVGTYNEETEALNDRLSALSANMGMDIGSDTLRNYGNFYGDRSRGLSGVLGEYALQQDAINNALNTGLAQMPGRTQAYISQLMGELTPWVNNAPALIENSYAASMNPLISAMDAYLNGLPALEQGQFNMGMAMKDYGLQSANLGLATRAQNAAETSDWRNYQLASQQAAAAAEAAAADQNGGGSSLDAIIAFLASMGYGTSTP